MYDFWDVSVSVTDVKYIGDYSYCVVDGRIYPLIRSRRNDGLIASISGSTMSSKLSVVLADKFMEKFILATPNKNDNYNYKYIRYIGEYVTCYKNGDKIGHKNGGGFHRYIRKRW